MSVSLRPLIFHTAIQTGIGALATRFYNGQSPLGKLIFGESNAPMHPFTGAFFGASSALSFHFLSSIFTQIDPDEEPVQPRGRIVLKILQHYAFIIYTGILAATIFSSSTEFPLSFKTSLILSAAMIGTVVEIFLAVIAAGTILVFGVGICLGCMYCARRVLR